MERSKKSGIVATAFALTLSLTPAIFGRVITVDNGAPADFATIQAAVNDANDGDVVLVAPGTYTGDGNRDIDFKGKAITVRSEGGARTCIINCQGSPQEDHRGFFFHSRESMTSVLEGFSIVNGHVGYGGGGICCLDSSPNVRNCVVSGNRAQGAGAGIQLMGSNATFDNCLVSGNYGYSESPSGRQWVGGGIYCSGGRPVFSNCTVVGNRTEEIDGGGMVCNNSSGWPETVVLNNCIIAGNIVKRTPYTKGTQLIAYPTLNITGTNTVSVDIQNSCIGGGPDAIFVLAWPNRSQTPAGTCIRVDPEFAKPGYWDLNRTPNDPNDDFWVDGDYHLKSQAGRWDPSSQTWLIDDVTSPCIDAGDPNSPVGMEPFPNGGRINMGAYGGTPEASKSYFGEPICETIVAGDINGDCRVDFADWAIMASHWLKGAHATPAPPPPALPKR
jgi:parallel beta-helix repeat protein